MNRIGINVLASLIEDAVEKKITITKSYMVKPVGVRYEIVADDGISKTVVCSTVGVFPSKVDAGVIAREERKAEYTLAVRMIKALRNGEL